MVDDTSRRRILALMGTGALATVAGCLGDNGDDESGESSEENGTGPGIDDYDPADVVELDDPGAVDDEYEFDRPDEAVELDEDVSESLTLSADVVHVVTDGIRISSTLTIEPGTVVEFEREAYFEVRSEGELIADGTEDEPILLTGTEESPGWWAGIYVPESESTSNLLNYVVVEYGGSEWEGNVHVGRDHREARLTITNCTLRHSDGYGLYVHGRSAFPDSARNDYADNEAGAVRTAANNAHYLDGGSDYLGNGEDAVDVDGTTIEETAVRWQVLNVPYRMAGETRIEDSTLEIEAGALLEFWQEGELRVRGDSVFVAEGTEDAPIVFTGTEATPGWWNGIYVSSSEAEDNRLANALVEYGGGGERNGNVHVGRDHREARLTVTDCTLRHSDGYGLYVHGRSAFPDSARNAYTGNEAGAVRTAANNAHYLDGESDYTGNGEDVVDIEGEDVEEMAVTWEALNVPYRMEGDTRVEETALEIEAGGTFHFRDEAELQFRSGSVLNAAGTEDAPIVFTGTDAIPGWWNGIYIPETASEDNTLDNALVEYGGGGERNGNVHVGRDHREAFVSVTNSTLRHSDGWGIWVHEGSDVNDDVCDVNEFDDNAEGDCEVE